jgi:glycosyltransferase involved in cell wall biosynthesis
MKPALVSVVIPTFNRANLLRECLNSVVVQTYRPLEIIVADDGSTDHSDETVAEFRERAEVDSGLAMVYLPLPRGGAPKARNAGASRATGEFIQYVDSDDLIHRRKIELHVAAFDRFPEADFVWSQYSYFECPPPQDETYNNSDVMARARQFKVERCREIPGMVHIGLFRRDACRRIGAWCESLARWQDVEYMVRFANLKPTVVRLPAVLYYLRRHANGQIQDLYKEASGIKAGFDALATIERSMAAVPAGDHEMRIAMANLYKSLAETALRCGLRPEFRRALRGAVRHRPDPAFRARALGIQLACAGLGSRLALRLVQTYHTARLPDPPECVD